jgi:hypothetical protein
MPRIDLPEIPDDIVNKLTTLESTKAWIKRLETTATRLEESIQEIRTVLKFVVYPTYNKLTAEQMHQERIDKETRYGARNS